MKYIVALLLLLSVPAYAGGTYNPGPAVPVSVANGGTGATSLGVNFSNSGGAFNLTQPINAQTGTTYTVQATDAGKIDTFSNASSIAVSLSQANQTGFTAGFSFVAANIGFSTVVITPTTSTIGGATALTLQALQSCTITSDGTNYQLSGCTQNYTNYNAAPSAGLSQSPTLYFSGNVWNSAQGSQPISASMFLTAVGTENNNNPIGSELDFYVGANTLTPTRQMWITNAGNFGTNGGATFSASSVSTTSNLSLINTAAANAGAAQNSNQFVLTGQVWNSGAGTISNSAYLQLLNTANNANPVVERLGFFTQAGTNGGSYTEQLSIANTGNVGIGSTAPVSKLTVNGGYATASGGRAVNIGTTTDTIAAGIASTYESANSATITLTFAAPLGDGERRRVCLKNASTVTWAETSPATAVAGLPTAFVAGQCVEAVYNSASGTPTNAPATSWVVY